MVSVSSTISRFMSWLLARPDGGDQCGDPLRGLAHGASRYRTDRSARASFRPAAAAGQGWSRAFPRSSPAGPAHAGAGWPDRQRVTADRIEPIIIAAFKQQRHFDHGQYRRRRASASSMNRPMRARTSGCTTASRCLKPVGSAAKSRSRVLRGRWRHRQPRRETALRPAPPLRRHKAARTASSAENTGTPRLRQRPPAPWICRWRWSR